MKSDRLHAQPGARADTRNGVFALPRVPSRASQFFRPEMSEHKILLIGGAEGEYGVLTTSTRSNRCHIHFAYRESALEAEASDYFEALCQVRRKLEEEELIPFCYGASLDVYPSGMARDMGAGLKAYKLTLGKHVTKESLVDIFAEGLDMIPAYVARQREYFEQWVNGAKA